MDFDEKINYDGDLPPNAIYNALLGLYTKLSWSGIIERPRLRKSLVIKIGLAIAFWSILSSSLIWFETSSITRYADAYLPNAVQSTILKITNEDSRDNNWNGHGYTVKPIAYVFPQFHSIPENDKIWGANWTEWDNVKRANFNGYGLETIKPHRSIGYYDGLQLATRKRQAKYLRDSGFYGMAFHHYWFAGRPVMDAILQQMLIDGEPNIPFMLNWANEPWTSRWDGADSTDSFIAQDYGTLEDWRKHFEWLLPFFRSPKYIRSDGKLQFAVYKPSHVGDKIGPMFTAWREWAVEEGLGGLDVIETKWDNDKWSEFAPDAVNQFMPHAGGTDQSKYPLEKRINRVFHRGSLVCWDTTPRHLSGGNTEPICHPVSWKRHMVKLLQKIKEDPNPAGTENFLFVNALNEWGEGNALEPTAQWEDQYGKAMKEAVEISNREHMWRHEFLAQQRKSNNVTGELQNKTKTDLCMIVHAHRWHQKDQIHNIDDMIKSLQALKNQNWRAIIYESDREGFVKNVVSTAFDSRIKFFEVPEDIKTEDRTPQAGHRGFEKIMQDIGIIDPQCGNATYMLHAQGSDSFHPSAFDGIFNGTKPADILSLRIQSKKMIHKVTNLTEEVVLPVHRRCTRFKGNEDALCRFSRPTADEFEFSATILNTQKFLNENITAYNLTEPHSLVKNFTTNGWSFNDTAQQDVCHVHGTWSYSACVNSGNLWLDSPDNEQEKCYRSFDFHNIIGRDIKVIDYIYYQQSGVCIRHTRGEYLNKLKELEKKKEDEIKRLEDEETERQRKLDEGDLDRPAESAPEETQDTKEEKKEDPPAPNPHVVVVTVVVRADPKATALHHSRNDN